MKLTTKIWSERYCWENNIYYKQKNQSVASVTHSWLETGCPYVSKFLDNPQLLPAAQLSLQPTKVHQTFKCLSKIFQVKWHGKNSHKHFTAEVGHVLYVSLVFITTPYRMNAWHQHQRHSPQSQQKRGFTVAHKQHLFWSLKRKVPLWTYSKTVPPLHMVHRYGFLGTSRR